MTGKEALEYIANLLFMFTSAGRKSGKNYTLKALSTIEDELDELAKYKRAFDILEDKLWIKVQELREWEKEEYKKEYELITHSTQRFITKKEYKLLEELMKSEI